MLSALADRRICPKFRSSHLISLKTDIVMVFLAHLSSNSKNREYRVNTCNAMVYRIYCMNRVR